MSTNREARTPGGAVLLATASHKCKERCPPAQVARRGTEGRRRTPSQQRTIALAPKCTNTPCPFPHQARTTPQTTCSPQKGRRHCTGPAAHPIRVHHLRLCAPGLPGACKPLICMSYRALSAPLRSHIHITLRVAHGAAVHTPAALDDRLFGLVSEAWNRAQNDMGMKGGLQRFSHSIVHVV